jgi:hypothetical protein
MSERIIRQVKAILDGNNLGWTERDGVIALRFASAFVTVNLVAWGAQTVIQLHANVLRGLGERTENEVLREVNALNCESFFGKWSFYADEGAIALEYDLLADHLQEAELMTGLASIARAADYYDDLLQERLGGRRAID